MTMDDIAEKFMVLLHQEQTTYKTTDYLCAINKADTQSSSSRSAKRQKQNPPPMHEAKKLTRMKWRKTCCLWAYQVVDFFDIDRAVVAIAMNFLDRYLATVPKGAWINKNYFQKIAMTSFYLAIKLNHTTVLCMAGANTTIESISLLSENRVAATEIEEMEVEMLRELQWYAHPPSPYVFLSLLMEGMGITDRTVCQRARFFIEESTMEYSYVLFPPSSIAAAALWNAMEMLPASTAKVDEMSLPKDTFDIHSPSIRACRLHLSRILEEEAPADEKSCIIIANDPPCQSPIAAKANKGQLLPSPASIRDPLIV